MYNTRTVVIGTVLALTALSGCGGDDEPSTPAAPGASTASESSAAEGTYKVGVYAPAQLPQGIDVRDGAQLAADELNAMDGAGGRQIETVFCDSVNGASPEAALACVNQFAQEDEVDAIVGGFSSGETLAVLDTVVTAEIPYLSTGAASPDVTKGVSSTERKQIFRPGPISSQFLAADMCATITTQLGPENGFTKFGILYEDVEFARPLNDFLQTCLPDPSGATMGAIPAGTPGVEVVATERHLPDATDFSSQFAALETAGAQFVIEVNSRQEGIALANQWGTLQPNFALGGISVSGQANEFFAATDGKAAYQLNGPAGITRAEVSEKTIPFYDAFQAKFGRNPIYNGASAYDSLYMLAMAVEEAGDVNPDAVITALEGTDYIGVQGRVRFGENHDVVYGAGNPAEGVVPLYFQYTPEGDREVVYPMALRTAEYMMPPWVTLE